MQSNICLYSWIHNHSTHPHGLLMHIYTTFSTFTRCTLAQHSIPSSVIFNIHPYFYMYLDHTYYHLYIIIFIIFTYYKYYTSSLYLYLYPVSTLPYLPCHIMHLEPLENSLHSWTHPNTFLFIETKHKEYTLLSLLISALRALEGLSFHYVKIPQKILPSLNQLNYDILSYKYIKKF